MVAPTYSWNTITAAQVDVNSPVTEDLMASIQENLIHLEEWLGDGYTAAKNHDHDNINSKSVALASNAVTLVKLKHTTGSWSGSVGATTYSSINLINGYSHFPKQGESGGFSGLQPWTAGGGVTLSNPTQYYIIPVYNPTGNTITWTGTYEYHSNSEQVIEVLRDTDKIVTGIHVREHEPGITQTIKRHDKDGVEINDDIEIYTHATTPSLFRVEGHEKFVKLNATALENETQLLKHEIAVI